MSAITELRVLDNMLKAQGSASSPSMVRAILELAARIDALEKKPEEPRQ